MNSFPRTISSPQTFIYFDFLRGKPKNGMNIYPRKLAVRVDRKQDVRPSGSGPIQTSRSRVV